MNDKIKIHQEPHKINNDKKLNWLRAAVLGANDGIVSVASIVVGVAGASNSTSFIFTAGVAGLVAGSLSMALGEYVSVSSQRDAEKALIEKERVEHFANPENELEELVLLFEKKGLSENTARTAALELTAKDSFATHLDMELGLNPDNLTNPAHAAYASALSFVAGAIIPLIIILILPKDIRIPLTFVSVLFALIATGTISAHYGGASKRTATLRIVVGGMLAMLITFGIGKIFGVVGI